MKKSDLKVLIWARRAQKIKIPFCAKTSVQFYFLKTKYFSIKKLSKCFFRVYFVLIIFKMIINQNLTIPKNKFIFNGLLSNQKMKHKKVLALTWKSKRKCWLENLKLNWSIPFVKCLTWFIKNKENKEIIIWKVFPDIQTFLVMIYNKEIVKPKSSIWEKRCMTFVRSMMNTNPLGAFTDWKANSYLVKLIHLFKIHKF